MLPQVKEYRSKWNIVDYVNLCSIISNLQWCNATCLARLPKTLLKKVVRPFADCLRQITDPEGNIPLAILHGWLPARPPVTCPRPVDPVGEPVPMPHTPLWPRAPCAWRAWIPSQGNLVRFCGMGMEFEYRVMFHCFREEKCQRSFTTGTWYYMCVLGLSPWGCIIGRVVSESGFNLGGGDRFPGGGICGLLWLQSVAKYLFFANIGKVFILVGGLGTGLSFYGV